ncbi:MAG: pyridoxal-phosphate dependent enzyme, partial [Clostridia bacterium]|nr:pyridoxal-phosphate dependent enzyme [Clostridia bacterium]
SGIGKYLKEQKPTVKIVGVEPEASPFLTKGEKGAHKIQGIGAGFKPEILNTEVIDEILTVSDAEAYAKGRELAAKYGLLVGISSGAAYSAALSLAKKHPDKNIVVIFPDSGTRYISTEGYY